MAALLLSAAVSFFLLVRDEILPDGLQSRFHLSALPSLPFWLWITVVAVLFILVVLEGSYQLVKEQLEKEAKLKPKLQILSGSDGSFRQERRTVSRHQRGGKEVLFRLGIKHTGTTTIDRVAVELESIEPPALLGTPLTLHNMNDNPADQQYRREFPLDVGQTEYVDVVLKHNDDDQPPSDEIIIYHIVPGVIRYIPAQRYSICVFAHGGNNALPVRQSFTIDVDEAGALQFERDTSCS